MNQTSRRRPGGRAGVLDLLASARPASLDPDSQALPPAASFTGATAEPQRAGQPELPERPHRRAGLRIRLAGAGVVATGATAALVIALTGGPSGTAPSAGGGGGHAGPPAHPAPSARAILLAAAVSAAKAPEAGRYWRVAIQSGSAIVAGPNAHPYAVMQRWAPGVYWDSRSPSRRTWTLSKSTFASDLVLPGARAAWKAAGSPALPTAHAREQAWWQTGGAVGYFGNSSLTAARFRALPADPARLATLVRRAALRQGDGVTQSMFDIYDQMLKWDPITPAVRAAVFRGLAALPGVRSMGRMTDPLSRVGYGIELAPGRGADRQVLIIAPGTGALLADEYFAVKSAHPAAASGAVPGPTSCPAHGRLIGKDMCLVGVIVRNDRKVFVPPSQAKELGHIQIGPRLALPDGALLSYDVVLRAGWTDAAPQLPPSSQQFSVARDAKG